MTRYDVIVLGGGIIGSSLAEELARRGQRVCLVESRTIGSEASKAAAGILSAQMDVDRPGPFFELCQAASRLYPQWIKRIERHSRLRVGYHREGVLYLAYTSAEVRSMERRARWQRKAGLPVERWTSRQVCRREPNLAGKMAAGFFFPAEGQVDNAKLMEALAVACRQAGVRALEHTEALRLSTRGDRVVGVRTQQGALAAPVVVNCLGSWAGLKHLTMPTPPVVPARGQILVFRPAPGFFRTAVMSELAYGVQRRDGRLLVGSTIEFVGYRKQLTADGMRSILAGFAHMVRPEALAQCAFEEAWAGLRPCSQDRLPILGRTALEGLYVASGHFRHGILLAPMTAQLMADLILTGRSSCAIDLAGFSIARFAKIPRSFSR